MSVSSDDILEVAKRLMLDAGEAFSRAAMGRSYYAAFHEARETVGRLSLVAPTSARGGSHERLISAFEGQGKGLSKFATRLRARKLARQKADYDVHEQITAEEAAFHLRHCEQLMNDLKRLASS